MSVLPTELENIVANYTHQLRLTTVHEEMHMCAYKCANCMNDFNETIKPFDVHCLRCDMPLCRDCHSDLNMSYCSLCNVDLEIYETLERIKGGDLTFEEKKSYEEIIYGVVTSEEQQDDVLDFFLFVEEEQMINENMPFKCVFSMFYSYINDYW